MTCWRLIRPLGLIVCFSKKVSHDLGSEFFHSYGIWRAVQSKDFAFLGCSFVVQLEHQEVIDIRRSQRWSCRSSPGLYRKAPFLQNLHWGCSLHNTGTLMALASLLLCTLALALPSYGRSAALEIRNSSDLLCTCNDIAAAISSASQVFFPRMALTRL